MPPPSQRERFAEAMGWPRERFDAYLQIALDMMPLVRSSAERERFSDAILDRLASTGTMKRTAGDEFNAEIRGNRIGYCSVAMFPDETRWTSAYLVDPDMRPSNLKVATGADIDRVLIDETRKMTKPSRPSTKRALR